jgi:hypothetical protein
MNDKIQYKHDDKKDWFANHTLSKEKLAQLILNKIERAKQYQTQKK